MVTFCSFVVNARITRSQWRERRRRGRDIRQRSCRSSHLVCPYPWRAWRWRGRLREGLFGLLRRLGSSFWIDRKLVRRSEAEAEAGRRGKDGKRENTRNLNLLIILILLPHRINHFNLIVALLLSSSFLLFPSRTSQRDLHLLKLRLSRFFTASVVVESGEDVGGRVFFGDDGCVGLARRDLSQCAEMGGEKGREWRTFNYLTFSHRSA
jgi:hypothetical protein